MAFLLDSNAVIALMNGASPIRRAVERRSPGDIFVSSIVMFELFYGAFNSERVDANLDRLAALAFPVVDFTEPDARDAGHIRASLARSGTPIGPYDVLIAGQALARGLTLVTNNLREFARVEGLRVEDWSAG